MTDAEKKIRQIFYTIRQRCNSPSHQHFRNYGGRGIRCEFESADEFYAWAMEHGYREGLDVDRIDGDGTYSPDNCPFVDHKTNCRRRKNTKWLVDGVEGHITLAEACEHRNVDYSIALRKLKKGVDPFG